MKTKKFLMLLICCCTSLLQGYLKDIESVINQYTSSPAFIMFYNKKKLPQKETTAMYGIYVPHFTPGQKTPISPRQPSYTASIRSQGNQSLYSAQLPVQRVQGRTFVQQTVPPKRVRPTDRPVYGPRQTLQERIAQKEPLKPGQFKNILNKPPASAIVKAILPTHLAVITTRAFKELDLQGIDTVTNILINEYGDVKFVVKKGGKVQQL